MNDATNFAGASDYDTLRAEIDTSAYLKGRSDIVEHYQDTYGQDWKTHIVNDIHALNPNAKRASIAREFQYDARKGQERYKSERMTNATKERYQALGKTLPPRGTQATVHFTGYVYYSGKGYPKEFTRELSEGQTADMLAGNFTPIMESYGLNMNDIEGIEVTDVDIWF